VAAKGVCAVTAVFGRRRVGRLGFQADGFYNICLKKGYLLSIVDNYL